MGQHIVADAAQFFEKINSYLSVDERICVQRAFAFARRAHGQQRRKSGELFFTHPLTVAYYLSEYQMDAPALSAALLHDIAEDTVVSVGDIDRDFGSDVALLVDGVTKLKDVTKGVAKGKRMTREDLQHASLHKMFGMMTMDVRTVIIKLFDRLHNLRTIRAMPPAKQRQKAQETLTVYAPLANRLGIWTLKNELEALSLQVLNYSAYTIITDRLQQIQREQQEAFNVISGQIFDTLLNANLDVRNVSLVPENVYSVYQDLTAKGSTYYDVDKTMRLLILLEDWPSCYLALGQLHQLWKPVPGTFDDYIAMPRDNLYRSLHTTVVHTNGQRIKLRLRTVEMNHVSEIGVLARWYYSGTSLWSEGIADRIDTFLENITENINIEPQNPSAGVKGVVEDVFRRQIRLYTPRGDVVELAQRATPIDFAYAIHTRLGEQCAAAYVNETLHPLNEPLNDGDRVRIAKSVRAEPQRAWLDEDLGYIATNYARSHVRRWFRRLPDERAVSQGKDLLEAELDMLGFSGYDKKVVAEMFNYTHIQDLYYALGRADLLPTVLATRILEETWDMGPARDLDNVVYSPRGEKFIITHADGRKLRLCASCNPRPRETIIGYIRSDGGATVHKESCHTLGPGRPPRRIIKLGWGEISTRRARLMTIQIDVYDRPGLLYEITQLLQREQINISYINTPSVGRRGETRVILSLEVVRPRQVVRILHQVQALENVFAVRCLPGGPPAEQSNGSGPTYYRPE